MSYDGMSWIFTLDSPGSNSLWLNSFDPMQFGIEADAIAIEGGEGTHVVARRVVPVGLYVRGVHCQTTKTMLTKSGSVAPPSPARSVPLSYFASRGLNPSVHPEGLLTEEPATRPTDNTEAPRTKYRSVSCYPLAVRQDMNNEITDQLQALRKSSSSVDATISCITCGMWLRTSHGVYLTVVHCTQHAAMAQPFESTLMQRPWKSRIKNSAASEPRQIAVVGSGLRRIAAQEELRSAQLPAAFRNVLEK